MESINDLEKTFLANLKQDPTNHNFLNKLGYIYLHSNNLIKSEEFYSKSILIKSDQFEPYVSLGLINTINLRLGKALFFLFKAQLNNPEAPELIKSLEEIKTAITNKYENISDKDLNELKSRALHKQKNNDFIGAIEIYIELINLYPKNERLIFELSKSLFNKKEYKLAINYLEKAIEISPNNAEIINFAGIVSNILEEYDDSERLLVKSLKLNPLLADILTKGKNANFKIDYAEETLDKCPYSGSKNLETINIVNQSSVSFNFNIINPVRVWQKCKDNGLVFANPRPNLEVLDGYNQELSFNSVKIMEFNTEKLVIETNSYNDRLNIIESLIEGRKCLDFSANFGVFNYISQNRDWDILSLEKNNYNFNYLKEKYDLSLINESIQGYQSKESFDLITCWESLEKESDFKNVIEKAYSMLNEEGLFAFSFHGFDTMLSKNLGINNPIWYYPDFLYFFSVKFMKEVVKSVGFSIEKIQIINRSYISDVEFYCRKL